MINQFPSVFTDVTGRFQGEPIKIQLKSDMSPVIQPPRRVPMHYRERLRQELEKMKKEDIIEEPGTFLSNLVITDRKGTDRISVMHQSIPGANTPPGNPRGFAPIFSPSPRDLYRLNCPGVARGSDLLSKYQVVS